MTEPIDQATKERIEKEAEAFSHRSMSDAEYVSILSPKGCYIAGASVWAERLKQERNKAIEALEKHHDLIEKGDEYSKGVANCINILYSLFKDKSHE